jgi:ribosome maturation factor RimP
VASHAKLLAELTRLAERICVDHGVELVDLDLRGSSRNRMLRVDVDRAGPRGVDLEDCRQVSEALGEALDESQLISDRYRLEVSSPGIDRPIRSADDIRRNIGRRVAVTTSEPVAGRRSFRGVLMGSSAEALLLVEQEDQRVSIPLDRIEKALQDVAF